MTGQQFEADVPPPMIGVRLPCIVCDTLPEPGVQQTSFALERRLGNVDMPPNGEMARGVQAHLAGHSSRVLAETLVRLQLDRFTRELQAAESLTRDLDDQAREEERRIALATRQERTAEGTRGASRRAAGAPASGIVTMRGNSGSITVELDQDGRFEVHIGPNGELS